MPRSYGVRSSTSGHHSTPWGYSVTERENDRVLPLLGSLSLDQTCSIRQSDLVKCRVGTTGLLTRGLDNGAESMQRPVFNFHFCHLQFLIGLNRADVRA